MAQPQPKEISMRGDRRSEDQLFSYVPLEDRVPKNHPLRAIRAYVDPILRDLSPRFDAIYSRKGRPSIPPEQLLRALLLQVLYSVRSERMLCEQLEYNLLFRWFVGLSMDDRVWVPTVFTKNRDRLLRGEIAEAFFEAVVNEARRRSWLSDQHFTVDGTLLEAYASQKSYRPKDEPPQGEGRNPDVNFRGQRRSNETHVSRTDPDARLAKKGPGRESKLAYQANALMDNRHGLIVDTEVLHAAGTAEREAALTMLDRLSPSTQRRTLGADRGYDTRDFVAGLRDRNVTPHVAQNESGRRSAIDGRTTSHGGYKKSQKVRKRVEEIFGWVKTVAGGHKLRFIGLARNRLWAEITAAAYNLVRATFDALKNEDSPRAVAARRGLKVSTLQSRRRATNLVHQRIPRHHHLAAGLRLGDDRRLGPSSAQSVFRVVQLRSVEPPRPGHPPLVEDGRVRRVRSDLEEVPYRGPERLDLVFRELGRLQPLDFLAA
jgi:transposase